MGFGDFTKSGSFVLLLLVTVVVGVPFGLEQIGETTGLFTFPVTKTIKGWFAGSAPSGRGGGAAKPVEWERYRRDLEAFTEWAEGRQVADLTLPKPVEEVIPLPPEEKHELEVWYVPVTSCTAGNPLRGRKGYVFISGFDRRFEEGDVIEPSADRCGYEIAFVGDRTVWFRAVFDNEGGKALGRVKLPEFTRVEDGSLLMGPRRYVVRDAFPLESGGWLTIDAFLPPDGVLFKLRDERREEVATLLCIVFGQTGGK